MLAVQRNVVIRSFPDWRVEGVQPAREPSDSAVGKRARQSPISAISRAACRVWARGRLRRMCASACSSSSAAIRWSRALIWSTIAMSAETKARVISAAAKTGWAGRSAWGGE